MTERARIGKRAWGIALVVCLVLLGMPRGAWAQDYLFSVDRNISRISVNRDGSADVEYALTFTCAPGAHEIDIVDIGLPNATYDLESAQAWYSTGLGGGERMPLEFIYDSEYLPIGVEVHLVQYAIQPEEQGTIYFQIRVAEMVYPDTEDKEYASVEFAPTYYGSDYVMGTTYMEVQLAFPPGVTNEETRYHEQPYDEWDQVDDRIVFIYTHPGVTGDRSFQHGISFPRTYVDQVYKVPVSIGTGGGGFLSNIEWDACCGVGFVLAFFVVPMGFGAVKGRKRKMKYLPPALQVEGVGVKRGLTAVEASILLERPLNKVLTMIMFGLVKKRALIVVTEDPLKLEKVDPKPTRQFRAYENRFLEAIKDDGSLDEKALQKSIVTLIRSTNKKMKGFSRKETRKYYEDIVDRAWDQVTADETPEVKSKHFEQGLEWMMMDDKFDDRVETTFGRGPVYMPSWWAYYRPWVPSVRSSRSGSGSRSVSTRPSSSGGGGQVTLPTLPGAAFASTLVGGMERTASGIVGKLETFTGGVTQRTNPPPVSTSSSSSSSRSGGCACACACACAGCACACAGGGR